MAKGWDGARKRLLGSCPPIIDGCCLLFKSHQRKCTNTLPSKASEDNPTLCLLPVNNGHYGFAQETAVGLRRSPIHAF